MNPLDHLLEWIAYKLTYRISWYMPTYLEVGGHCGLCGKWIPDVLVHRDWSWSVCEKCKKGDFE